MTERVGRNLLAITVSPLSLGRSRVDHGLPRTTSREPINNWCVYARFHGDAILWTMSVDDFKIVPSNNAKFKSKKHILNVYKQYTYSFGWQHAQLQWHQLNDYFDILYSFWSCPKCVLADFYFFNTFRYKRTFQSNYKLNIFINS